MWQGNQVKSNIKHHWVSIWLDSLWNGRTRYLGSFACLYKRKQLHSCHDRLTSKWKGPYLVTKRINDVNHLCRELSENPQKCITLIDFYPIEEKPSQIGFRKFWINHRCYWWCCSLLYFILLWMLMLKLLRSWDKELAWSPSTLSPHVVGDGYKSFIRLL